MFNKGGMANLISRPADAAEYAEGAGGMANVEAKGRPGAPMVQGGDTCKHDVKRVTIDASCDGRQEMLKPDRRGVETTPTAAPSRRRRRKWADFTSGLNLPPGMKLPF